jgi:hypothetical protein
VTGQHSNQLNYRSFFDVTAIFTQMPVSGHQPPFFHPKDGKDNGFLFISSKLSCGRFSRIHSQSIE